MKKVYSIFLSDEKMIEHLDKIQNKSQYFRELVQRDMKKEPFTEEQISYIQKIIKEKLQGYVISNKDNNKREETVSALDDLLNDF